MENRSLEEIITEVQGAQMHRILNDNCVAIITKQMVKQISATIVEEYMLIVPFVIVTGDCSFISWLPRPPKTHRSCINYNTV